MGDSHTKPRRLTKCPMSDWRNVCDFDRGLHRGADKAISELTRDVLDGVSKALNREELRLWNAQVQRRLGESWQAHLGVFRKSGTLANFPKRPEAAA